MPRKSSNPADRYEKWHWGIPHSRVIDWDDPDFPDRMIEIGRLVELHVKPTKSDGSPDRTAKKYKIELSGRDIERAHVSFDMDHPAERIYLMVPPDLQAHLRRKADQLIVSEWQSLRSAAQLAGGRQAKLPGYPSIDVQILGRLTNLVYKTEKKGDGISNYIHKMGEEGGVEPLLTIDEFGRLWVAGGSYFCPNPGITF